MVEGRRVLVLGSGGREHALARALARSPSVGHVLVAPGNGGIEGRVGKVALARASVASSDPEAVVALAREQRIDLVVVGPEAPLCAGVVDALAAAGITAFGPSASAAKLEGSKVFMKRFAARHGIPTAPFEVFDDLAAAERYIDARGAAVVVKTDGLAGGKGAIVTSTADEAKAAAKRLLEDRAFGEAGARIVIEDRLPGDELSVHVISDGERFFVLPVSRDHKRVGDGDAGPNTGGMGAFAPVPVDDALMARIEQEVIAPTIDGMRADGAPYRGVLYAGLMIAPDGTPNLLEHNVRFGDPETQVLMALLDGDVAELLDSAARGALAPKAVKVSAGHATVVVLASEGYPASARKGDPIEGLEGSATDDAWVIQAGTRREGDAILTAGGRVLGVVGTGATATSARERAYALVDRVHFQGMHFRRDIAATAR